VVTLFFIDKSKDVVDFVSNIHQLLDQAESGSTSGVSRSALFSSAQ
jgi:hypothetical protein